MFFSQWNMFLVGFECFFHCRVRFSEGICDWASERPQGHVHSTPQRALKARLAGFVGPLPWPIQKEHRLGWANISWILDHICIYYIYIYSHKWYIDKSSFSLSIYIWRNHFGHTGHNLLPSFTSNSGRFNRRSHNVLTLTTPWPHLWKRGVREPQIRRGDKEIPLASPRISAKCPSVDGSVRKWGPKIANVGWNMTILST